MTAPDTGSGYGSAADWAEIIKGGSQGASNAMQSATAYANSRKEAREAKRRTMANLLSQALKRRQKLFRLGQESGDETADIRAGALQQTARGLINTMQGTTG